MRVLFLTNVPSPYRVCFFNELGKLCRLTVLYELDKASDRVGQWQEFSAKNYEEIFLNGTRTDVGFARCKEVKNYLTKNYDIIVVGGYASPTQQIAIKYLKRKRIRFILNADGGFVRENELFFKKWYKSHLIKKASAYITTGKESGKFLHYYGAAEDRISYYPFSANFEAEINAPFSAEQKTELKKEIQIREEKAVISVGSFIPRKGMDILLKAAQKFKDKNVGFYLIGGAPNEEYLSLADNSGKIHFIPHLAKSELIKYYNAADIFVLMTREDIWGLIINEAMAASLPVITTDKCIAGLELVQNEKNGFIVPVDDDAALFEKLEKLLKDEEACVRMGRNNNLRIKNYTFEKMAAVHMEVFQNFLEPLKR